MTTNPILKIGYTGGGYCEFCKYPSNWENRKWKQKQQK